MKLTPKDYIAIFFTLLLGAGIVFGFRNESSATSNKTPSPQNIPVPHLSVLPDNLQLTNIPAGQTQIQSAGKSIRVPILMYHHVGFVDQTLTKPDPLANDLTVSPNDFEAQVAYFKGLGYQSVTIREVYNALENNAPLPAKPIVFMFDDGYKDVFTYAIPILQKYNYTGSFAISTALLGRPTYAVWDDIIAAYKAGMEIISHTENHLDLTSQTYADYDLHREIFDSKQILEQKIGAPVDFFVYPYGHYNDKVEQMVKDAGYKMAFTTAYGQTMNDNSLLAEPRVRVHGGAGSLDKLKLIFSPVPQTAPVPTNP